jgi:Flp pilus assembly pilin Flp
MPPHSWTDRFRSRFGLTEGQTMAEYAVVLGVIVPAIILAYALLSGQIAATYTRVIQYL